MNEVYGMSECCGGTSLTTDECHLWGTAGFPMPGVEMACFAAQTGHDEVPRASKHT